MDPVTIAVAQAGVQLYSMFRSSGDGIGNLLAAQTRMLQEIAVQIGVINVKLDAVYRGILDLEDAVQQLPRDTALKVVETTLSGLFIEAKEVLGLRAEDEREHGMEYALREVTPRAMSILDKLSTARSSLIADGSATLSPFVAAAWYVELQLMASCIPFKEGRLEKAAETYAESFEKWLQKDLRPTHRALNAAAVAMRDKIKASEARQGYDCYHSIHLSSWEDGGVGGRHGEPRYSTYYTVTATKAKLSAKPSAVRATLVVYRDELAFLTDAGIDVNRAFFEIAPWHWTQTATATATEFQKDGSSATAHRNALAKDACAEPTFVKVFATAENKHETAAEELFARRVVNAHLMLVCEEALASVRAILARAKS
ncbi:MAG: hypothetical protein V4850_36680 [Myxococcota bacterium]